MTDKLGCCSEHLCKAVVYMAASDGTSQEATRNGGQYRFWQHCRR